MVSRYFDKDDRAFGIPVNNRDAGERAAAATPSQQDSAGQHANKTASGAPFCLAGGTADNVASSRPASLMARLAVLEQTSESDPAEDGTASPGELVAWRATVEDGLDAAPARRGNRIFSIRSRRKLKPRLNGHLPPVVQGVAHGGGGDDGHDAEDKRNDADPPDATGPDRPGDDRGRPDADAPPGAESDAPLESVSLATQDRRRNPRNRRRARKPRKAARRKPISSHRAATGNKRINGSAYPVLPNALPDASENPCDQANMPDRADAGIGSVGPTDARHDGESIANGDRGAGDANARESERSDTGEAFAVTGPVRAVNGHRVANGVPTPKPAGAGTDTHTGTPLPRRASAAAGAADSRDAAQSSQEETPVPPTAGSEARGEHARNSDDDAVRSKSDRAAQQHPEDGRGGAGNGNDGRGTGGGGDGGGNDSRLTKRAPPPEYRDILKQGLTICRSTLVSVGIFSIVVNMLVLAVPIYLFQIADRVLSSRSTDTLIMLTIVVVGALGVHVILDMMRRFMLTRTATRMETRLGGPILGAAVKASDSGSSREFQALLDLQTLRSFITGPVTLTFFDAPVAPLFILVVFLIHPHLGIIITCSALALLVLALINQKLTAVPFALSHAFSQRANLQAEAMARNAQVMNAMGMIPEGILHWGRETAESLKNHVVAQDRNIYMTGISKFLRLNTQIAILGWGAYLAIQGHLTGGMIIAASIIGSRALAPIEGTIEGWRYFIQARSAYGRIKTLLQSTPLAMQRLQLPRPQGHLSVERVLYVPAPSKQVILNGVTFALEPGESLAIVGPSGTGKSTLARMLVGSIYPTAGGIRIDMMDLRNWDPRQFGEVVGYLPQDVELFPASIKANIARMREDVSDESIYDAAELAGVHDMISHFPQGYETQIAVDGSPLSGGQKQRIALARAFYGDPRFVVLDEPNSNLDTRGEIALANALKNAREKQITVVTITQRPALLSSVDKIMLLHDGRVQAFGARDEILAQLTHGQGSMGTGDPPANSSGNGSARLT